MSFFPFKHMNNKNTQKINFQHVYYKKFIIAKEVYYCQRSLLLQEVYYKKQGRKIEPERNLQTARKKARMKEKNPSEIYKKQGKRQGRKKNPKQNLQRATKKKKTYDSHPDDS